MSDKPSGDWTKPWGQVSAEEQAEKLKEMAKKRGDYDVLYVIPRHCARCQKVKPIEEFRWRDTWQRKRQAYCRTCQNKRSVFLKRRSRLRRKDVSWESCLERTHYVLLDLLEAVEIDAANEADKKLVADAKAALEQNRLMLSRLPGLATDTTADTGSADQ